MSAETKAISQAVQAASHREGKYLTFTLAGEDYGIGILKIKEIIGMMPITTVPRTPDFVKGVINLRGKVIPVIDLRMRFAMDQIDYNERTCIIVVEIGHASDTVQIGIVVDAVSEVLNIKAADIDLYPVIFPQPVFLAPACNNQFSLAAAQLNHKFLQQVPLMFGHAACCL